MAEILQSHLSHPVLSFYRAQHWGQSWLVSLTTVLDACALLIAGGKGRLAAQARITYRMGIRLLKDLTDALKLSVNPRFTLRLSTDDLPALIAAMKGSNLLSSLGTGEAIRLLRLVRRHDAYLTALSRWLVIPLPSLTMPLQEQRETEASSGPRDRADLPVPRTTSLDRLPQPADGQADIPPGVRKP